MTRIPVRLLASVLALVTVGAGRAADPPAAPPAAAVAPVADDLAARLEIMAERLDGHRREMHVPGMALAVVKDDAVIFARGFGLADVDAGRPVTADTVFAVGSTTKALTAALVGMLVDEGRMDWDDPVTRHLPGFHLSDADVDARLAVRDLLCHRTGLASMTLLWYGNPEATPADMFAAAGRATLLHPFREKFNYNNLCFLAAGEAAARTAGADDWDALVRDRLFTPLGMRTATTTIAAARAGGQLALGYGWDADDETLVRQEMRPVTAVAPAGAINASVRDMAEWVRFQLARGVHDGERLLSAEAHAETWAPQITVGGDVAYGLGWFLRDRKGQLVVDHGGGIDGFTAEVALLPEKNLGFVLLTNLFATPLGELSREVVFSSLLDPPSADPGPGDEDLSRYVGSYMANFAAFKNAAFAVSVQNGRLAVDVPGQMVFELHPPDADGKRSFLITDQVAVRFNPDDDGNVVSMSMFQAGLEFELPREGVVLAAADDDLPDVSGHLGTYHFEQMGAELTVQMQNGRLAVDVPGQMVFEMHPPDADGRWVFRVTDSIFVTFETDEANRTVAMTMTQDGVPMRMERTGGPGPAAAAAPDVEAVLARVWGGRDAAAWRTLRTRGRVAMPHMGIEGRVRNEATADGRSHSRLDLGRYGTIETVVGTHGGWTRAAFLPGGEDDVTGEMLLQARLESPFVWLTDWRRHFASVNVVDRTEFDGTEVDVIRLRAEGVQPIDVMVSVGTGLVIGQRLSAVGVLGQRVATVVHYSDHRPVDGVMLPHRVVTENDMTGAIVVEVEAYEPDVTIADATFER